MLLRAKATLCQGFHGLELLAPWMSAAGFVGWLRAALCSVRSQSHVAQHELLHLLVHAQAVAFTMCAHEAAFIAQRAESQRPWPPLLQRAGRLP